MKLIVGLGNPGKEYENTRHNIGFMCIDKYAETFNVKLNKEKFNGLYQVINVENENVILLKPLSYMNLSGEVVIKFLNFYKINIDDLLIISDDLDMPTGKIKLKSSGSSGGHNGLKNIELHLGTQEYKRLKIGISNNKLIATKDYVLGKFSIDEQKNINNQIEVINNILNDFLKMTFDQLMSKYNKK